MKVIDIVETSVGTFPAPHELVRLWREAKKTKTGRPDRRTNIGKTFFAVERDFIQHKEIMWLLSAAKD